MAIATEISRVSAATDRIKVKTEALGLKLDNGTAIKKTDKIEKQAEAIENIETFTPSTINLDSSSQTIECGEKYVTEDIVVPAANKYYTGSSTPTGSVGNDGDIYLVI